MFSIFKTAEDIQKWIDYRSNYKSQEELIKSYNPLESDFNPDEAYAEINNFKSDDYLDNFTTQYDGVLGALQIAYFETHLNVDPLDHITASPDLVTLDNMPKIEIMEPEQVITYVNRWRIRQYLKGKAITLTDKHGNEINYDVNNMLSEVTHYGYISITYNLGEMLEALPCKWPRNNWENKELNTLVPKIQESITELYRNQTKYIKYNSPNGFGTTNTAFHFLSAMLILCTCYPNAICHIE